MAGDKIGLFTGTQYTVLKMRSKGLSQREIAETMGTTRQNISLIERRAHRNVSLAEETLKGYRLLKTVASIRVEAGTHLVDVPRLVMDASDEAGVKLRGDFNMVYNRLRYGVPGAVMGTRVVKDVAIHVLGDGDIEVVKE